MDDRIKLIIACEALKGELSYFRDSITVEILWVEQYLHDVPDQLHAVIQQKLHQAEDILPPGSTVLLMFGNCGGALNGLRSQTLEVIYPDVDDCIPLILGSKEQFNQLRVARPGTFYFNKAWIDSGKGPLSSNQKYVERYGFEKGWRISRLMYKNYTHFALIDNGCYDLAGYRDHVHEACQSFDKIYIEEKGSLDFIQAALNNRCSMRKIPPRPQMMVQQEGE